MSFFARLFALAVTVIVVAFLSLVSRVVRHARRQRQRQAQRQKQYDENVVNLSQEDYSVQSETVGAPSASANVNVATSAAQATQTHQQNRIGDVNINANLKENIRRNNIHR